MAKQFPVVLRLLLRPLPVALLFSSCLIIIFILRGDIRLPSGSWIVLSQAIQRALHTIAALGWLGVLGFLGLYLLATVLVLPCTILTLSAGVLYGPVWGVLYVFLGALLGAGTAFLLGRYVLREWVEKIAVSKLPTFQAIQQAVGEGGVKVVVLTRLSPLFPFSLLSYAYGLTPVKFRDYLLGSVGMLPATILYVYSASLVGDLANVGTTDVAVHSWMRWSQWGLRLVGLAATIGVSIYVTSLARQALAVTTAVENQAD